MSGLPQYLGQQTHIKAQVLACYREATETPWLSLYQVKEGSSKKTLGSVKRLSYRKVVERASVLAEELKTLTPAHSRVLISMTPHEGLYITHLACLLADLTPAIFHPPNPKQSVEAFKVMCAQVLSSSEPSLVIGDEHSEPTLSRVLTEENLTERVKLTRFERCESRRTLFKRGLLEAQVNTPATEVAFLQYSSGTTGAKKGVIFKHHELLRHLERLGSRLALNPRDHIASWLPLYHDMGFIACWLLPLLTGVKLSTLSPHAWVREPTSLFELVAKERATLCWLPNFAFALMSDRVKADPKRYDLKSLRQLTSCSEYISYGVMSRFAGLFLPCGLEIGALATSYAMAENIFAVTHSTPNTPLKIITVDEETLARGVVEPRYYGLPRAQILVSCGVPIRDIEIVILDEERSLLEDGHVGHIAYQSDTLFGGYLLPKVEEALLTQDSRSDAQSELYVTQDLGFLYEGHLYVLGRSDDVMIIGGKNLYPYDVEALLNERAELVPGRSVAVAVKSEREGTEGIIVLAETKLDDREVISALGVTLKQRLTSALDVAIREVLILPYMTLSKSTSGKLSRGQNRARYLSGELVALALNKGEVEIRGERDDRASEESELFGVFQRALSEALNLPSSTLKPSTRLFSSGLLDSLNAHLFFDALSARLRDHLTEASLSQLKHQSVELDELSRLVAWCEERGRRDQCQGAQIDRPSSLSEAKGESESLDASYYKYFSLHGSLDDEFSWYKDAYRLSTFSHKLNLQGGGWLESPNVETDTISTNGDGFRVSLYRGEVLTGEAWSSATRKAVILGDSSIFGVGVADAEVVTSVMHTLNPDRRWLNCAVRGGMLATLLTLAKGLDRLPHAPVVVLGTGDFKSFNDNLIALTTSASEAEQGELWGQFLESYQETFIQLANTLGGRLLFIHQPRILHAPRVYQRAEADAFWRGSAWISKLGHQTYFGAHPDLERYAEAFGVFLEDLAASLGVKFLNYATDPMFHLDEKLYHDTSHYTALMHSLLALKLNEDLDRLGL